MLDGYGPSSSRVEEGGEKAASLASMTGWSARVNFDKQTVAVGINRDRLDLLSVSRSLAFVPERLTRPAPEPGVAGLDGFRQLVGVHISEHQDLPAGGILNHHGHKPTIVKFHTA